MNPDRKQCSSAMKMSESATFAQRRHIGLQQLQAIASTACAFLGPNKRLKFIQDEDAGDAVLVRSCPRLLKYMELDGSVTQLLNETVQAQQKVFHSGTATLMFLAGAWSRVALECLNRGISVIDIKTAMSKGLEECLDACIRSAVSLKELKRSALKSDVQCTDTKPTQNLRITLKHSRHFTSHDAQTESTESALNDVTHIAQAVSHGRDASMHLVLKAYELQNSAHLDIQKLVTCCIPGKSENHSCVLHGYVTLLSVQQALVVQHLQGDALNIALINGDLSEEYRHVGFNRPANVRHIADCFSMSTEELWIENALKTLHEFSIEVVLVSGVVDVKLKERCSDILIIEGVKPSVLKDFSTCTGAIPVSYISQLDKRCVGRGLRVRRQLIGGRSESVSITTDGSSLVTAVITSSTPAKLQILEDDFWSCAHRLHQALTDGKLLYGAGITELICIRRLHQSRSTLGEFKNVENPQESVVLELMAEAWMDFISTVKLNSGSVANKAEAWTSIAHQMRLHRDGEEATDGVGVYDNVTVKCEAWRRALDLVFLVLQTDTEIITGVIEGENAYKQLMFL